MLLLIWTSADITLQCIHHASIAHDSLVIDDAPHQDPQNVCVVNKF